MKRKAATRTILLLIFFTIASEYSLFAQVGELDSSFSSDGKVLTIVGSYGDAYGGTTIIQPDGKILIGGEWNGGAYLNIIRYNSNGSLDSTFGINGIVSGQPVVGTCCGVSIALQQDGKILQSGSVDNKFMLARYDSLGNLDPSFGISGVVEIEISPVNNQGGPIAVQTDGKILIAGSCFSYITEMDFGIAKLNEDGSLDNTFGINGKVLTDFDNYPDLPSCMTLQSDGKILVGGWGDIPSNRFEVARYNPDGSLDNSFGQNGRVTQQFSTFVNQLQSIVVLLNGEIILTGTCIDTDYYETHRFKMSKLNPDGSVDYNFGVNGVVNSSDYQSVVGTNGTIQQDGKILLAGSADSGKAGIERYYQDGTLDLGFGDSGLAVADLSYGGGGTNIWDIVTQPDGKIVIGGYSEYEHYHYGFVAARFLSGLNIGILNLATGASAMFIYPNPIQSKTNLQYTLTNEECLTISLYNMQGSKVQIFITNETRNQGEHREILDLDEALPSGEYILNISNGVNSQNIKVVKE